VAESDYKEYGIRRAMADDAGSSIVYVFDSNFEAEVRSLITIRCYGSRKTAWCESVFNDEWYRTKYNQQSKERQRSQQENPRDDEPIGNPADQIRTIVMGRWYRAQLGIMTMGELPRVRLAIKKTPDKWWLPIRWWVSLRLSLRHPVSTNRLATYLAIIGVVLGVVGILLGVIALKR
jgi:hypothetical protein